MLLVVSAVADCVRFITSAPTEPPINAATKATGSNLFVIIIALFSSKRSVLLKHAAYAARAIPCCRVFADLMQVRQNSSNEARKMGYRKKITSLRQRRIEKG